MKKLMMIAALLGGCSSSDGTMSGADMALPGGGDVCTGDGQAIALGARYGVQANLLVNVKVTPGCSGVSCIVDTDANAELLLLVDTVQTGQTVTVTATPCKIVIPPVALKNQPMPVQLTVPRALVDSIKPVTASATLDGANTCARFESQPITIAIGANLANPGTDALPKFTLGATPTVKLCGGAAATRCLSPTTPAPGDTGCVCDQEGDAILGASLTAMNVPGLDADQVFVDLRTSVSLSGQVFPKGALNAQPIKGKVVGLALDQNVVGCHLRSPARACGDADVNTVAALNPAVSQSVNGDSTFKAIAMSGQATCDQLIANEGSLFNN